MPHPISAAILAGGKSSRLGLDKAQLRLSGCAPLVEEVTSLLGEVAEEVLVVGRAPGLVSPYGVRSVTDIIPEAGSLGGLYTALACASHHRCVVVGCDMPFLDTRLLGYMVDLSPGYDIVIPRVGTYLEPLHAVYSRTCLGPVRKVIDSGRRRIYDFLHEVSVRYVEPAEILAFDPDMLSFFNINTTEQMEQAAALIKQRRR
jgi:molybdenum cofactor guanylyltransferase